MKKIIPTSLFFFYVITSATLLVFLNSCGVPTEEYLQQGRDKLSEQRYAEALSLFEEALRIDPSLHEAWNAKGVAAFELAQHTQALNAFNKAIELAANDYRYFYNRGNVQRKLNAHLAAYEDYTTALALDTTHYEVYLNRALTQVALKKITESLADFDRAARLTDFGVAEVLLYRGKVLLRLLDFQAALEDFQQVIALDERNAEAWYEVALAYQGLDDGENSCRAAQNAHTLAHPKAQSFLDIYCKP